MPFHRTATVVKSTALAIVLAVSGCSSDSADASQTAETTTTTTKPIGKYAGIEAGGDEERYVDRLVRQHDGGLPNSLTPPVVAVEVGWAICDERERSPHPDAVGVAKLVAEELDTNLISTAAAAGAAFEHLCPGASR